MTTQTNEQRITALAQVIGTDVKGILANIGDLSALTTTQKASLVLAMNELKAAIDAVDLSDLIDDSATANSMTWSSTKISNAISAAVSALVNSAPEAMDTLKELADAISNNQSAIGALQTIAGKHVRYDEAQTLTDAQQTQARSNIAAAAASDVGTLSSLATTEKGSLVGAVNEVRGIAETNKTAIGTLSSLATSAKGSLVAAVNEVNTAAGNAATAAATADGKAVAAQNDVDALETALGTIDTDYAAIYTAARKGTSS